MDRNKKYALKKMILWALLPVFIIVMGAADSFSEAKGEHSGRQRIVKELVIPGYIEKLKLTKSQQEKFVPLVEALFKKRYELMQKVREGNWADKKTVRKELRVLREHTEEKMKDFLTKGQLKEFRELEQKQREKVKDKVREKRGLRRGVGKGRH